MKQIRVEGCHCLDCNRKLDYWEDVEEYPEGYLCRECNDNHKMLVRESEPGILMREFDKNEGNVVTLPVAPPGMNPFVDYSRLKRK